MVEFWLDMAAVQFEFSAVVQFETAFLERRITASWNRRLTDPQNLFRMRRKSSTIAQGDRAAHISGQPNVRSSDRRHRRGNHKALG